MTTMIAMHYPSASAPPVGVWWWDEASATVRRHYLADFDGVVGVAEELANVKTPAEWAARLVALCGRVSEDKVRTTRLSVWSPVEVLDATVAHWALRW